MMRSFFRCFALISTTSFVLPLLASPALAVDGVLEINQTCAVQTGCFPNDGPGYPVFIDQPGSYRLTSNLVILNENTDGIRIGASSISIDLNGFEIVRQGCEGAAVACVPESGTGSGIELSVVAEDARGISVKNGSIVGMGAHGVALGGGTEVTNLRVRWNRLDGISVGSVSLIVGNIVYRNGEDGIQADTGSSVMGNTVVQSGGFDLNLGSQHVGYRDNTIQAGSPGSSIHLGTNAGGNVCNGAICP
jgi:hypothetical protein